MGHFDYLKGRKNCGRKSRGRKNFGIIYCDLAKKSQLFLSQFLKLSGPIAVINSAVFLNAFFMHLLFFAMTCALINHIIVKNIMLSYLLTSLLAVGSYQRKKDIKDLTNRENLGSGQSMPHGGLKGILRVLK